MRTAASTFMLTGKHTSSVCMGTIRRISLRTFDQQLFTSQFERGPNKMNPWPRLTVTDITNISDEQIMSNNVIQRDSWVGGHRHPVNAPYDVVRRGVLSCFEMTPDGELKFSRECRKKVFDRFLRHV